MEVLSVRDLCSRPCSMVPVQRRSNMRRDAALVCVVGGLLMCLGTTIRAQVSIGVTIGQPPAPRVYRVPPQPGPEFVWVEGYWYPQGHKYRWHDGYWTRAPFAGAY